MPDTHVHLDRHPNHPGAVTATLTNPDTRTRTVLRAHGFRHRDRQTLVMARIDHEEPHHADQAALALEAEGITVTPGLQDDIDTEWTWANYPMPWLTREEIRDVSNEAQKIHDAITAGHLTIHAHAHAHAHAGWTTVAVGTYRGGRSVHLHGEDHLRQITDVFPSPETALTAFTRLHGDAVHPGPAPATTMETHARAALTDTAPPAGQHHPATGHRTSPRTPPPPPPGQAATPPQRRRRGSGSP